MLKGTGEAGEGGGGRKSSYWEKEGGGGGAEGVVVVGGGDRVGIVFKRIVEGGQDTAVIRNMVLIFGF